MKKVEEIEREVYKMVMGEDVDSIHEGSVRQVNIKHMIRQQISCIGSIYTTAKNLGSSPFLKGWLEGLIDGLTNMVIYENIKTTTYSSVKVKKFLEQEFNI